MYAWYLKELYRIFAIANLLIFILVPFKNRVEGVFE